MKQSSLEEFYNDMKHGVYNFTKDGNCSCCGNCCTALLPVTKDELKVIKRYIKRHNIKPIVHNIEGVDFDLTCPFRNEDERICNIYEIRPQICRDFKCDKPQKKIDDDKEHYSYDKRYHVVNMRDYF